MTVKTMIEEAASRKVNAVDASALPRLEGLRKSLNSEAAAAKHRLLKAVSTFMRQFGASLREDRIEVAIAWEKRDGRNREFQFKPTEFMRKLRAEENQVQDQRDREIAAIRRQAAALQQKYFVCGKRAILTDLKKFCGIKD